MRIQVRLEVPDQDLDFWVGKASIMGFLRKEPRKVWTKKEQAEAVRWVVERTIQSLYKKQ